MRCLYCGKELALLRRLTGGGEFCSEGHKQSYQEEYNRLALSRLLQAQKKVQQSDATGGRKSTPPASTSVAVEEPVAEPVEEVAETEEVLVSTPAENIEAHAVETDVAE